MKNSYFWLAGRHSRLAFIFSLLGAAAPFSLICIFHSAYRFPAFASIVCFPDSHAEQFSGQDITTVCPPGHHSLNDVTPMLEIMLACCIIGIFIALSPLMPSWEECDRRRIRLSSFFISSEFIFIPVAANYLLSWLLSSMNTFRDPVPLSLITTNALIDSSFFILGMAVLGHFYGLGLGLILMISNTVSQNVQIRPGFALRLYPAEFSAYLHGQIFLPEVCIVLLIASIVLWSASGGRGLISIDSTVIKRL